MRIRLLAALTGTAVIATIATIASIAPASALTMQQCSSKYQAAKDAGTLGGLSWNDYRKTQCASETAAPAPAKTNTKKGATAAAPVEAKSLTMQQCGAKYQAAKDAGVDNGIKWNDFRKAECGPGADLTALSTDGDREPPAPTTAAPRGVTFPSSVSSKFSNEKAGKARMHTCLEQYHALKDKNALNGLKWVQKGGGYYSICNARLKGIS
ncbi:antifreeze protein [Brucellaceae bacterium C25G]